jgi:hypothetical protein
MHVKPHNHLSLHYYFFSDFYTAIPICRLLCSLCWSRDWLLVHIVIQSHGRILHMLHAADVPFDPIFEEFQIGIVNFSRI